MTDLDKRKHKTTKIILKLIGFTLVSIGTILIIMGLIDFFNAFADEDMPRMFILLMVGIPLAAIGTVFLMIGFKKEIVTYMKNETISTYNDIGKEITPTIKNISKAAKEGENESIMCSCGEENNINDKFCKNCGRELYKICKNCGEQVELDCKFCPKCGEKID